MIILYYLNNNVILEIEGGKALSFVIPYFAGYSTHLCIVRRYQ